MTTNAASAVNCSDVRLDEFDKIEWWDVARRLKPELTWDEYEAMWAENQARKAERQRLQSLN